MCNLKYNLNLNFLVEYKEPRMNIMINDNWKQTICGAYTNEKYFHQDYVILPVYFEGWSMKIPSTLLNNQSIAKACTKVLNQYSILKLTDSNWTDGVSKDGLILLLKNDSKNSKITTLNKIKFLNGETRRILKIDIVSDKYLYIYIGSPIFDINSYIIKIEEENEI